MTKISKDEYEIVAEAKRGIDIRWDGQTYAAEWNSEVNAYVVKDYDEYYQLED